MKVIVARNVNDALVSGLKLLQEQGVEKQSRNGRVLEVPAPVTTYYAHPEERVLFCPERDANPFFHLYESMWMLGGHNDVERLAKLVKNMANYSDDGETFHGAYGYRWRHGFGPDNLEAVIQLLREDNNTRRAFLPMWDGMMDPWTHKGKGKDYPCNVGISFQVRQGQLDMTVFNRSNDAIWGAYGANAVHFSILQEYVAQKVSLPIGIYHQVSNNFHAYLDFGPWAKLTKGDGIAPAVDLYTAHTEDGKPGVAWYPMKVDENFDRDCRDLLPPDATTTEMLRTYRSIYFHNTVIPALMCWQMSKEGLHDAALRFSENIEASDWATAVRMWVGRRLQAQRNRDIKERLTQPALLTGDI